MSHGSTVAGAAPASVTGETEDHESGRIEIERARPEEYGEIGRATELAFRAGAYGDVPVSTERHALVHDVEARTRSGEVLVARQNGAIVGTVTLLRAGTPQSRLAREGEAELRLLAVHPDARGQGLGRALALAAEEVALGWGSSAVVLDTGARNLVAQSLYRQLGYTAINRSSAAPKLAPVQTGGEQRAREQRAHEAVIDRIELRKGIRHSPDVIVRLARETEYEQLADLTERAYSEDYEISEKYRIALRNVAERAREHQVWVAADAGSGELLGAVATPRRASTISPLAQAGELDFRMLAVDRPARGRGIGALLTRHVIELARLRGLEHVVMNSGPQMVGAHRLYEKLGFRRMPDREPVIDDGVRSFRLLSFTIAVNAGDAAQSGGAVAVPDAAAAPAEKTPAESAPR